MGVAGGGVGVAGGVFLIWLLPYQRRLEVGHCVRFDLRFIPTRSARAKYDCDAEDLTELSFKKDELLLNCELYLYIG